MAGKQKRNLSGIYFREKVGKTFDNICFEDLPKKSQEEILEKNTKEWCEKLCLALGETINELGTTLDLVKE